MKDLKISVITPAYNVERYIKEAIDSILSQTLPDFEFIILDDCSTDNTWEIIKQFAGKDNRIIAVRNEVRLGIAGNRNKGVSLAKGKYIVWQDADDISIISRLEKQYQFMEKNSDVGICGGYLQFFSDKGESGVRKYATDDKTLRKSIFRYSPVAQPAAIIRKKCFDDFGEYDLRYPPAEDLDMSFRIGTKYKFANLPQIVIKYRENYTSATFTRLRIIEVNTLEIRKKYARMPNYNITFFDKIYNIVQYISMLIIPARIKIWLFDLIRND